MATRSHTEAFILLRNNALQDRYFSQSHGGEDKEQLLRKTALDLEPAISLPPQWQNASDQLKLDFKNIRTKMFRLNELHNKHLNRPTMNDDKHEEQQIQTLTNDITTDLHRSHDNIRRLQNQSRVWKDKEEALLGSNIVSTVARELQELSSSFRTSQSLYLSNFEGREQRHSQYFDNNFDVQVDPDPGLQWMAQKVEDRREEVETREREIEQIVRSIQDLNDIFKELSIIIVDQGTILDRIDYNIESTSVQVEKGMEQLQKAQKHSKKNRKMMCVFVLFVIVTCLFVVLIVTKT